MSPLKTRTGPFDEAFIQVQNDLVDLNELALRGEAESEEANAIRDGSDEAWFELTEEQQDILNGLSSDLLDMQKCVEEPILDVTPPGSPGVFAAIRELHNGEAIVALNLLRENKHTKPFSRVCFFRGRCWEVMGQYRVAHAFFQHAHKLAPRNEEYAASALAAFCEAYPEKGKHAVQKVLERSHIESPLVVIRASEIAFQEAQNCSDNNNAQQMYDRLTWVLHDALRNLQGQDGRWKPRIISEQPAIYGVLYSLVAACCRNIGKLDAAFHYFTLALGIEPFNSPLMIARGVSVYGLSQMAQDSAALDFQRAIALETELVIPHYFLAHYLLHRGQFEECIKVVDSGVDKVGLKRIKSEMLEFRAISLAAIGTHKASVRKAFKMAQDADETNKRVASNLKVYEALFKGVDDKATIATNVRRQLREAKFALGVDVPLIASQMSPPLSIQRIIYGMAA